MNASRKLTGLLMIGLTAGLALAPAPTAGEAFSLPTSNRVIEGEIKIIGLDDIEIPMKDESLKETLKKEDFQQPFHFSAREGTMVTITYEATGRTDAWIPILDGAGQPTFRPLQISADDKVTQPSPVKQIIVGDSGEFKIDGLNYQVDAIKVFEGYFPNIRLINPRGVSPDNLQKLYGKSGGGICCVSCGGVTVCASSVDLDCGYCGLNGRPYRQI